MPCPSAPIMWRVYALARYSPLLPALYVTPTEPVRVDYPTELVDTTLFALLLFFFQAEDGIRDTSVTGVQTCALPIGSGRGNRCRVRLRHDETVYPVPNQASCNCSDRIGRDYGHTLVEGLIHDQPPSLLGLRGGHRGKYHDARESVVRDCFVDRHIACKADSLVDAQARNELLESRALPTGSGNNENRVLEARCRKGLEKVWDSLDRLEASEVQDHILSRLDAQFVSERLLLGIRDQAGVERIVHRVGSHENALRSHAFRNKIAFDMLAVDDDRVGMAIKKARKREDPPVQRSVYSRPKARPKQKRHTFRSRHQISGREGESAVARAQNGPRRTTQKLPRKSGCNAGLSQAETAKVFVGKISSAHSMLGLPIPFPTVGVEKVLRVETFGETGEQPNRIMRTDRLDKRKPSSGSCRELLWTPRERGTCRG